MRATAGVGPSKDVGPSAIGRQGPSEGVTLRGDRATATFEDICNRAIAAKFYAGRYTKAARAMGRCTLGQCPLIQLWRPPVYCTFGPGVSRQHTPLGKRSCLLALRSIATAASHQSRPKISTGHLAKGQAQLRMQRRLNYRVSLNLRWIGSCANASHANRQGS
jgi:hypothetical protein